MLRPRVILAFALALLGCGRNAAEEPAPPPPPSPATTPLPAPRAPSGPAEAAGVRYLEQLKGGASAEDRLPMIVAIHGLGDSPDAFQHLFDGFRGRARLIIPYGEPWQTGFAWWPISSARLDMDRVAAGCDHSSMRLSAMMDALVKSRPTAGKPIVTGFSQGGMLSFTLAVLHPEAVAEAVPVSGLLAPAHWPSSWPAGKETPPIFALHGDADDRVPLEMARKSVDKLRKVGFTAELREYPGVGHTISAEMRRDLYAKLEEAIGRADKR